MAKWKGITADELMILRQIQAINYQIRQVAAEFGTDSRLYKQYESMLFPRRRVGLGQARMTDVNAKGIVQIKAGKSFVRQYVITAYTRELNRLSKMRTVGQEKQSMIEAYELRTKKKVKTRAERAAVVKEMIEKRSLFDEVNEYAGKYYELEKKLAPGMEFASHRKLRELSKGYWSSDEDLKDMIKIMKKELKAEKHRVTKDYLEGL